MMGILILSQWKKHSTWADLPNYTLREAVVPLVDTDRKGCRNRQGEIRERIISGWWETRGGAIGDVKGKIRKTPAMEEIKSLYDKHGHISLASKLPKTLHRVRVKRFIEACFLKSKFLVAQHSSYGKAFRGSSNWIVVIDRYSRIFHH